MLFVCCFVKFSILTPKLKTTSKTGVYITRVKVYSKLNGDANKFCRAAYNQLPFSYCTEKSTEILRIVYQCVHIFTPPLLLTNLSFIGAIELNMSTSTQTAPFFSLFYS